MSWFNWTRACYLIDHGEAGYLTFRIIRLGGGGEGREGRKGGEGGKTNYSIALFDVNKHTSTSLIYIDKYTIRKAIIKKKKGILADEFGLLINFFYM